MSSDIKTYKVSSEKGLWDDVILTVQKGIVIGSSYKRGVEIGSNFESLKSYWEQFEGENKYVITELKDNV